MILCLLGRRHCPLKNPAHHERRRVDRFVREEVELPQRRLRVIEHYQEVIVVDDDDLIHSTLLWWTCCSTSSRPHRNSLNCFCRIAGSSSIPRLGSGNA